MAAKKAKFRVGQIVCVRDDDCLIRIADARELAGVWFYYCGFDKTEWRETELRSLTAREKGRPNSPRSSGDQISQSLHTCKFPGYVGVNYLYPSDPDKVWRCEMCEGLFWFINGRPVPVKQAAEPSPTRTAEPSVTASQSGYSGTADVPCSPEEYAIRQAQFNRRTAESLPPPEVTELAELKGRIADGIAELDAKAIKKGATL